MKKLFTPKRLRILRHIVVGILFYLLLSFVLFLGLQVKPLYGNIGVVLWVMLLYLYIRISIR